MHWRVFRLRFLHALWPRQCLRKNESDDTAKWSFVGVSGFVKMKSKRRRRALLSDWKAVHAAFAEWAWLTDVSGTELWTLRFTIYTPGAEWCQFSALVLTVHVPCVYSLNVSRTWLLQHDSAEQWSNSAYSVVFQTFSTEFVHICRHSLVLCAQANHLTAPKVFCVCIVM